MRALIVGIVVLLAACDRGETPPPAVDTSAKTVARTPVESGVSTIASAPDPQPVAGCGGSCGGSCGGGASCGGAACGGHVADTAPAPAIPAGAVWTDLHVAGMKCGGCARRIKTALAHVDGVLGVEVDLATAQVRVATTAGIDGRGLAQPAIDALGYQVQ